MDRGTSVGELYYDIDADDNKLTQKLDRADKKVQSFGDSLDKNVGQSIIGFGEKISNAGNKINGFGSAILSKTLPAAIAFGGGMALVSKMAFNQVGAVQQATLALKAYEKNGKAVDKVLSGLLAYARSDLGVLFNRADLFAAAQNLKIMGDATDKLVGHVKIMSRSIGLGLSTWEELNRVIGRVGSTGRLAGDDFDYLTKSGYKLDPALRNTNVTFDELFKALDKGIPVDALAGQADTLQGIGVRLQTAFRGIGEAILGVDKDTGQFIKGGAGDQLTKFLKDLPDLLKRPKIQEAFKNLGQALSDFVQNALPKLIAFMTFVGEHIDVLSKLGAVLIAVGIALKIIGTTVTAIGNVITMIGYITKLAEALKIATAAQWAFNAAQAASPYVILLAAIIAVGYAIYQAINHFRELGVIMNNLTDFFTHGWGQAIAIAIAIIMPFIGIPLLIYANWTTIQTFFVNLWHKIYGILQTVISWVSNNWPKLIALLGGPFATAALFIATHIQKIVNTVRSLPGKILGAIGNIGHLLWNTGHDVIQGFLNGMGSLLGSVGQFFINRLPGWIKGPFKKALGIASPSKVFAGYGEDIIGGLVAGLDSTRRKVGLAVEDLNNIVVSPTVSPVHGPVGAGGQGPQYRYGDTNISIGEVNNKQDENWVIRRINRNGQLAGMGGSPVGGI